MQRADQNERACVFLDRDGTLIEDVGYAHRPDQLVVLPGVVEGLCRLRQAGCLLIVVTNQSGVARGYFTEPDVQSFHAHLDEQLGASAAPDAYYYCPFHPEAALAEYRRESPLRKPDIGMFERACTDFAVAGAQSFMVGDKPLDVEFGRRAGLRSILLGTTPAQGSDFLVLPDFASAVSSIVACLTGVRNDWAW